MRERDREAAGELRLTGSMFRQSREPWPWSQKILGMF